MMEEPLLIEASGIRVSPNDPAAGFEHKYQRFPIF